jgi:transposase
MKLHGNARTCPHSRLLMVGRVELEGWTLAAAAQAAGVSVRTVSKWLAYYRAEGEDGLLDRSSVPRSVAHRTPEARVQAIAALRRLRMTAAEIAESLRMPLSTVSAVLTRVGLGKRSRLEPPEPANRYERKRPGELIHLEVKKLGRIGRPGQTTAPATARSSTRSPARSSGSNTCAPAPTGHAATARSVYQDRGAVRLDGEAAHSPRSDSGKRHVEDAL